MPRLGKTLFFTLISVLLGASAGAGTGDFQASALQGSAPEAISESIRETLAPEGIEIQQEGEVRARLWLRESLLLESGGQALGVTFGQIPSGTLLGVIQLQFEWIDYKNKPVPPGLYTLRYGLQPADGNHIGVSSYRDFAILIPASADTQLDADFSAERLNELSQGASGTPHPAIMALFPIWEEVESLAIVPNELDQPTLAWTVSDLTIGLVLEGHGELEGY